MSHLERLRHQLGFDLLIFRRNPAATFFTVALPLIFLFIFTSIFGNEEMGNGAKVATLYVPGILSLAVISATAVNLAITMTNRRERGILKRVQGTPVPRSTFIFSQMLAGFVISLFMTALVTLIGRLFFGVSLNFSGVPSLLITVLLGAMAFSTIGLALTVIIPSEEAAPAVTNAIMLPLYFISDVFIAGDATPKWVQAIGNLFPVRHLTHALQESFDPFAKGVAMPWNHWLVVAAWGAVAAAVAFRFFRWTPDR